MLFKTRTGAGLQGFIKFEFRVFTTSLILRFMWASWCGF